MSVKYRRPEVVRLSPIWKTIRDVLSGPKAMKDAGKVYLPMPNPEDTSDENKKRYEAYKLRAIFYEATSRTHDGLVGQIFYRDPVVKLPGILSMLQESVDGGELTLEQQARDASATVLALGHGGLLTDYPSVNTGATRADQEQGKVRPTIVMYQPEQIINWRWSTLGSKRYLSMLVLEEEYDAEDDGFEVTKSTQWRVLRIESVENGPRQLHVEIHRETQEGMAIVEEYWPRRGNGKPWDIIPFSPMGSTNNDPIPDKPPLEGMAHLNVGHYRNSADYEESCHMTGQPTPWGSGLTEEWVEDVWKGEFFLGSRAFIPLPEGGSCGLLQPEPNTMPKEAMDHKERQMVALGAKLVEMTQVQRTATEASADNVVENSVLSSVAKNVSSAYMHALTYAAEYANVSGGIEFELNTDFEIARMSAQERQQLMLEWQGGGITWEEYRWNIKRSGIAFENDAQAKTKIGSDLANSLNLEDDNDADE